MELSAIIPEGEMENLAVIAHPALRELLRTAPTYVNQQSSLGKTALFRAAELGKAWSVEQLLRSGADAEMGSNRGAWPLFISLFRPNLECVEKLWPVAEVDVRRKTYDDSTLLHAAAAGGCSVELSMILERGPAIDLVNERGESALLLAAHYGRQDCVDLLIQAGASIRNPGHPVGELLIAACHGGVLSLASLLIEAGFHLDPVGREGTNTLLEAASQGHADIVSALLHAGCKLPRNKKDQQALLMAAARGGCLELFEQLLSGLHKSSTEVVELNRRINRERLSMLKEAASEAAKHGQLSILERICDKDLDLAEFRWPYQIFDHGEDTVRMLELLTGSGAAISSHDPSEDQPVELAASASNVFAFDWLIQAGASVDHQTLSTAVTRDNSILVERIISSSVNVNGVDEEAICPLEHAVDFASSSVLQKLLRAGGNLAHRDERGRTLLHRAVAGGRLEIINALIEAGADVRALDNDGLMPLHALPYGMESHFGVMKSAEKLQENRLGDILQAFASQGVTLDPFVAAGLGLSESMGNALKAEVVSANARLGSTGSLLHWAVRGGSDDAVEMLLNAGADLESEDEDGNRPLHEAARLGRTSLAQKLMRQGAQINASNKKGQTSVDVATTNHHAMLSVVLKGLGGEHHSPPAKTSIDIADEVRELSLDAVHNLVQQCRACEAIAARRQRAVFGHGSERARVMLLGSTPSLDDEAAAEYPSGPLGKFLQQVIDACGLKADDVYFATMVCCPLQDPSFPPGLAVENCRPYLNRQIDLIRPKVILLLGDQFAGKLLKKRLLPSETIETTFWYRDTPVLVTCDPNQILESSSQSSQDRLKKRLWADCQRLMILAGLPIPARK